MGGGYLNNNKLTSNKKYIVLLLIFLLGFLTIYINTSYGLFKKKDYLTDINFVTGTLDYKIENVELENNSITLAAGSERKLTLTLTSLNPIDSKYELYYLINGEKVNNPDIEIGYTDESIDSVKGTILANVTKEITISIKNNSSEALKITLGCEGGLINNELVLAKGNSLDRLILSDDLIVAYTYVGEKTEPDRFPNKGEGYFIKNVTCNGMAAEWNNSTWSLTFSNVTGKNITCNFDIIDSVLATDYIMTLAETNTNELRIDEHEPTGQQTFSTTEYRYFGATPNNYVQFNNELWRIIGVFDVDDGAGNIEKRLKIIRNESIGNYSWDISTYNDNLGINEWSQSDIKNLLNNNDYYNCIGNHSSNGLTMESKEMIGNAKWYLGASTTYSINSDTMYNNERGNLSGKQCSFNAFCNDNVTRLSSWIGQIGIIYPSDYGYSANMDLCKETNVVLYNSYCYLTSWILPQWTITSLASASDGAHGVYNINGNRVVATASAANSGNIYPTVYLLPNIKIIDGIGTDTQPYILSK